VTIKLETFAGQHIRAVSEKALATANDKSTDVEFEFNGTTVIVRPGESADDIVARWDRDREAAHQAYINSDEYKQAEAKRAEEYRQRCVASMRESAGTEKEMRETPDKWPYTPAQLNEYIESLVDRQHDYGTCVYAMSLAAVAAFNYVAHRVGASGFQSSCADLDVLRRTRHLKGPFMIVKAEDALYPQSDPLEKLVKAMEEWQPFLKEEARKKLAETPSAHPAVLAHWKELAE
jgi:hypothetical protein